MAAPARTALGHAWPRRPWWGTALVLAAAVVALVLGAQVPVLPCAPFFLLLSAQTTVACLLVRILGLRLGVAAAISYIALALAGVRVLPWGMALGEGPTHLFAGQLAALLPVTALFGWWQRGERTPRTVVVQLHMLGANLVGLLILFGPGLARADGSSPLFLIVFAPGLAFYSWLGGLVVERLWLSALARTSRRLVSASPP
ncbi:MAG: hypothetical protein AAF628_23590 [Planctomycetota bacterium]